MDEFAFLSNNLADEFIASVFPTLSSSKESKLVITSTPNGLNAFYKIWKEAQEGINDFVAIGMNSTIRNGQINNENF